MGTNYCGTATRSKLFMRQVATVWSKLAGYLGALNGGLDRRRKHAGVCVSEQPPGGHGNCAVQCGDVNPAKGENDRTAGFATVGPDFGWRNE
jgi:hypothetical protein